MRSKAMIRDNSRFVAVMVEVVVVVEVKCCGAKSWLSRKGNSAFRVTEKDEKIIYFIFYGAFRSLTFFASSHSCCNLKQRSNETG